MDIEQLKEDQEIAAKRATTSFQGGLITRNEGREIIGMEPLDAAQGDIILQPVGMEEIPVSEDARKELEERYTLPQPTDEERATAQWTEEEEEEDDDAIGDGAKTLRWPPARTGTA